MLLPLFKGVLTFKYCLLLLCVITKRLNQGFENALQNPKNFAYLQMFAIFKHHKISKPLIAAPGHPQTLMFSISTYYVMTNLRNINKQPKKLLI